MADELKLTAEVIDKFSSPLRELQKLLRNARTEADKGTREQTKQNEILDRGLQQTTRTLREGLAPALSAVGLNTLSVAGAITAIGAATANFGSSIRALDLLSKQSGQSVDNIRALQGVAAKFLIVPESIEQGVVSLSDTFQQLKRNVGPVTNWLREQGDKDGGIFTFGEALKHAKNESAALMMVFAKLNTIHGAADRRTFLGGLQLPQEWAKLYGEDLPAAMEKWSATHTKITAETRANAAAWQESWEAMKQSVVNLRDILGTFTLGPLTTAIDAVTAAIAHVSKQKLDLNAPIIPPSLLRPKPPASFSERFHFQDEGALPSMSSPRTGSLEIPGLSAAWQKDEAKKGIKEGTAEGVVQGLRDYFTTEQGGGGGGGGMIGAGAFGAGSSIGGFRPGGRTGPGAVGGPGLGGGGANFMKGARPGQGDLTTVQTAAGPITVNKAAAGDMKGFVDDMVAAGAPKEEIGSFANRNIAGSNRLSQHAYGTALDYGQSSRNVVSRKFGDWASGHRSELKEILGKRNMVSGGDWKNPDFGHFEWGGPKNDAASVRGSMFNDRTTASGLSAATTAGIALPKGGKMGDMYEITTPDGRTFKAPLIDRGPAAWTKRGVDVSEPLARQMGYGRDFPTDSKFGVERQGLLGAAQKSGFAGTHKIEGSATIDINMKGQPPGTRTWLESHGIFDTIRMNKGRTMVKSADD